MCGERVLLPGVPMPEGEAAVEMREAELMSPEQVLLELLALRAKDQEVLGGPAAGAAGCEGGAGWARVSGEALRDARGQAGVPG
jgi:hypothetical protein